MADMVVLKVANDFGRFMTREVVRLRLLLLLMLDERRLLFNLLQHSFEEKAN